MALGVHMLVHYPGGTPLKGNRQLLFRAVGDHFNDEAFGRKMDRIKKLFWEKNINYSYEWSPAVLKERKKYSPDRLYRFRRTKFINRIKKKYPLFASEFIKEKYSDYNE
ncbi:MAG: hypothetical protein IT280_12960 [Ignavibacteria bacterium]|nr:hypothetical protein [Ignavibacteria bacterium]